MACTPTPTQTIFTTTTSTTSSAQTITTTEVDTITQASLITTTTCNVENSTTCVSSSVVTLTSLIPVVTTVPVTTTTNIPVYVTQTIPVQTLFANCPTGGDTDTTPVNSPTNEATSTSTPTRSIVTVTQTTFITTYSDSNGLHTSTTTGSTDGGQLSPGGGNGNKSSSKTGPIVGGIVGGVVAILAIIGLVWYILWRRNQTKFLFDEDDDVAPGALRPKSLVGRKGRRSLNLDEEVKGESNAYQYGMVGGTPSPSTSPLPHSQYSSFGGYSHRRNGSRDALMASGGPSSNPSSPSRLDIPLGGGNQRRISQISSTRGESIMMQPPVMNRPSDDVVWGHHPRPSSSLLEAPLGQGFYQQYGPLDPSTTAAVAPAGAAAVSPTGPTAMHKPALEPTLLPASQPPHQALLSAAGLAESAPGTSRGHVMIAPPPGAGGARPFVERPEVVGVGGGISNAGAVAGTGGDDLLAAVMAGADRATSVSPTSVRSGSTDVGFGRQRRPEKTPRVESPRSPVVQHQDGGRVPDTAQQAPGADAPPPAYSQS